MKVNSRDSHSFALFWTLFKNNFQFFGSDLRLLDLSSENNVKN